MGRNNLVVCFLRGSRRLPRPLAVPRWDLPTVLRALNGSPFEPLQSASLRTLLLKTALRYGNEYHVHCRAMTLHDSVLSLQSNLPEILWQNACLFSQMAMPILVGFTVGLFFNTLHEPMAVQLHCEIEKSFHSSEKMEFFPH